jgi:hypothetical protein
MEKKILISYASAFMLCLLLCSAAWPQEADCPRLQESEVLCTPLWEQLKNLSVDDKENALIQLEALDNLPPAVHVEMGEIEDQWNTGNFDSAIRQLYDLEQRVSSVFAAGVTWKEPKTAGGPDWGNDVQVEFIGNCSETSLDYDAGTGNLFAVIRRSAGAVPQWDVNLSMAGGGAWVQTYAWFGAASRDVSAVVVGGYLYVGYVAGAGGITGVARRFFVATGLPDPAYPPVAVFAPGGGVTVQEVALTSNADGLNNRVHYFAIFSNNYLAYAWENPAVPPPAAWNNVPTGIWNANQGLDATFNQGSPAMHYVMASYSDVIGLLRAAIRMPAGWLNPVFDNAGDTAISAYNDTILIAYEHLPAAGPPWVIRYQHSNNGGIVWNAANIPSLPNMSCFSPNVSARNNGGIAVVYQQETGGEPDPCWYTHTPYAWPLVWSGPFSYNEMDVITGTSLALEYLPPLPGAGVVHSYGSVWLNNIAAAFGGTVNFSLDAGVANAGRNYLLTGSLAGTVPGIPLPGGLVVLPLNWPLLPPWAWIFGMLDGLGQAAPPPWIVFGPLPPAAVGLNIHWAFALSPPWNYVSNPVMIRIIP